MKTVRRRPLRPSALSRELAALRLRLAEAEETLHAIRAGDVDAVVIADKQGPRVFTLEGAEHAYRLLIESMNEGALTLTADKTILYANQRFAGMVKFPLEQVIGGSFRRYLSAADLATLRPILKRRAKSGSKLQVLLNAGDGSQLPAQISIRPMARNGFSQEIFGVVVTDMTELRRNEELLRALSEHLVRAQEAERGRVALELHDNITQLLCAILVRSQALADKISARDGPSKKEALRLREMIGKTAEEVERISRDLRPSVLDQLGLAAALRGSTAAFVSRTGVSLSLAIVRLSVRIPAETELTLYRILQEALRNVEEHSRARHVTVRLRKQGAFIHLTIQDDGIGFDTDRRPGRRKGNGGLGLLSMRERAAYVGGTLEVKSVRRAGTEIEVRVPLASIGKAADSPGHRKA
jgi:two-component system, NarL family, sensor kinase